MDLDFENFMNEEEIEIEAREIARELVNKFGYTVLNNFLPAYEKNKEDIEKVKQELENLYLATILKSECIDFDFIIPGVEEIFSYEDIMDQLARKNFVDFYDKDKFHQIVLKGSKFEEGPERLKNYLIKYHKIIEINKRILERMDEVKTLIEQKNI